MNPPTATSTYSDRFARLMIGSNTFLKARAFVNIDGEEQMHLERGKNDHQLLLTTDIYSSGGIRIARLNRNAWAFRGDGYDITTSPSNLRLRDTETGTIVFSANVVDLDTLSIDNADFYGMSGSRVVATPEAVKINDKVTIAQNTMVGTAGIRVGPMGFAM